MATLVAVGTFIEAIPGLVKTVATWGDLSAFVALVVTLLGFVVLVVGLGVCALTLFGGGHFKQIDPSA